MTTTTVNEGDEYQITISDRLIYRGIAESDTEASERLEDYLAFTRLRVGRLSDGYYPIVTNLSN